MPSFETLEQFARRVEEEMPQSMQAAAAPKSKRCPSCASECELGAQTCKNCGHAFPERKMRFKNCSHCNALNPVSASSCQHCGASFAMQFSLTLDEALRMGVIVRGIDIDEDEAREAEALAPVIRSKVLKSGDARLIKLLSKLPQESWARLKNIMDSES
jgi:hypothetical protein